MNKQEIKDKLLKGVKDCAYVSDIKWLAIFGSYVSGEAKESSDVDVLIDFTQDAHVGFFKYVRIRRALSEMLGLEVDMVTPQALSKYIKDDILQQAETVYER
ncbi:MAG TPA: nucleotidyltransferase family protein [Sedimentisphaerales bacterium]|nr:nucleotidyltransferase family protein [Sedimentisphaerales bacterium]